MEVQCIDDSDVHGGLIKGAYYTMYEEYIHDDDTLRYRIIGHPSWSYYATRFIKNDTSSIDTLFEEKVKQLQNESALH